MNTELNYQNLLSQVIDSELASCAVGGKGYVALILRVQTANGEAKNAYVSYVVQHDRTLETVFRDLKWATDTYNQACRELAA